MIITDKDNYYNTLLAVRFLNHRRQEFSQEDDETIAKALEQFMRVLFPVVEKYGWAFRITDEKDTEYEKLIFCTKWEPHKKKIAFGIQAADEKEKDSVVPMDTFDWGSKE